MCSLVYLLFNRLTYRGVVVQRGGCRAHVTCVDKHPFLCCLCPYTEWWTLHITFGVMNVRNVMVALVGGLRKGAINCGAVLAYVTRSSHNENNCSVHFADSLSEHRVPNNLSYASESSVLIP